MDRRFALLPLVLALAACASVNRDEVAAPADGGAVAMRVGTALVVSLPPDPDSGSGWVLQSASPNLALVGGPDYTPSPKPPGLVGVADTTAFRFRARDVGTGTLEFAWVALPAQAPASAPVAVPAPVPARTVRYDVTIGPNFPDAMVKTVFGPPAKGQGAVNYWIF